MRGAFPHPHALRPLKLRAWPGDEQDWCTRATTRQPFFHTFALASLPARCARASLAARHLRIPGSIQYVIHT